ncbi:MAG: sensor histidine kinase [Actinomycetota bacterium]
MTGSRARWAGLLILATCLLAVAASVPIDLANRFDDAEVVVIGDPQTPRVQELLAEIGDDRFSEPGPNPVVALVIAMCFLWMLVGVLIVSRQPGNWAGWTFLVVAGVFPLGLFFASLVSYGARSRPGSVPWLPLWAAIGEYTLYPIALLPLLFLLYPDGHPPSPRWRWVARGLLGGTALAWLGFFLRPGPFNAYVDDGILFVNPTGIDALAPVSGVVIAIGAAVAIVSAIATAVAVTQRFRRSTGEERQQMRVLALVAGLAGTSFVLMWVISLVAVITGADSETELAIFPILFGFTALCLVVGIPVAYLVAIFRHGLWDLDVVIRKTVRYAVVVVAFMVLGLLLVAAVPTLLFGVGASTDLMPTLLLAGVLAAAFLWLRPRAARLADRLVYGRRATPYEVLSQFSERLGGTYSTDDVLPRMAQLVADATGARRADVWSFAAGELRPESRWPADVASPAPRPVDEDALGTADGEHLTEVRHQGELLGAITLEPSPEDPMVPTKEALVRDLAAQAGLVLRNVRLIGDLRASRQRLVKAQDEERRRLERNIHDGVQQQLVALQVQLRLARTMLDREPAKAGELLDALAVRSTETLDELRDLARGIYPPLLADQGLAAALEAQARKAAIAVSVEPDGIGRYAQEIEATVYFCVLEALNNVAKYAEASHTIVSLSQTETGLSFSVADDGRGFDPRAADAGSGLQGMADRVEAIGGSIRLQSSPGAGTSVSGSVPTETRS